MSVEALSDEEIDRRLDVVLRAAGSGLRFYILPCSRQELRRAMRDALAPPHEGCGAGDGSPSHNLGFCG